jgi:O-antigen/teichoic acid export membrane protein
MQAHVASISADSAPSERAHARLISIPFLVLRSLTAAGAFGMGLVQTLVFARVLSPDRFSVFIVVGAIGYSLWLCDLGLAKILFVELRAARLAGKMVDRAARHATAVIVLYVLLAAGGSFACFGVMVARPSYSTLEAADFALFFLYVALNLAWFSLRSISISVDEYVFYEKLELTRRTVNITTMLAMLGGLPFTAFLVSSNALWAVLLTLASSRLIRRGALVPRVRGFAGELTQFFRLNRKAIARSGTSALSDLFTYSFPYYVVPTVFGLGAPVIILEATFRIFRGASMIYVAACDLAVPGQTRALAARDPRRLIRTTLLAAALCCIPAAFACAILVYAAQPLFAFLLRSAATVPPPIADILVVLLLASLVHMVSQSLLQHTGFFREIARIGLGVAIAMIVATGLAILAKFDIVGFIAAYATVYTCGAIGYVMAVVRGPIREASRRTGG